MKDYLFTSPRLGFRTWEEDDYPIMTLLNQDDDVMEFFPEKPSEEETYTFVDRMNAMLTQHNFCYFAVDVLESKKLIGFIGLSLKDFLKEFDTFIDIGWRLKKEAWGYGYATEGAKRCLSYGFKDLNLKTIYAVAPVVNQKSIAVMKKIGMTYSKEFRHPLLNDYPYLETCALYKITSEESK